MLVLVGSVSSLQNLLVRQFQGGSCKKLGNLLGKNFAAEFRKNRSKTAQQTRNPHSNCTLGHTDDVDGKPGNAKQENGQHYYWRG